MLSNFLKKRRLYAIKKHLKGDILDVGCGSADVVKFLKSGQRYVGIEQDKNFVLELSRRHDAGQFFCRNLETDSFGFQFKFDTVLLLAVIEHLSDPKNALNEIKSRLKENGAIVITTLTPFANKLYRIGARFGLFSEAAVVGHKKIYDYEGMKNLLESSDLKIVGYRKFEFGLNQEFVVKLN